MIEIKGRKYCENCFLETAEAVCPLCGYDSSISAEDPTLLAPGTVLSGKYVIGTVIGKGGFGVTYLAYDTLSRKKAAIKEYFPRMAAQRTAGTSMVTASSEESRKAFESGAEKFYEEAKLVSKFSGDPNIVEVYEYFYENDTVYLAMEYLRGQTLKEYIRERGVITAPQALCIAKSVGNALSKAHKASVLHRDITPDNIILCSDGNVKLIDFGAARQVIAEYSQNFSVILKPGFAPPEQYNKKGNQGPWTDVYALGATLYFALTGDIPEDPMARFDDDDTFKENQFDIDPELWSVIIKATSLKNEDRYKSAEEMLADLDKIRFEPQPVIPDINDLKGEKGGNASSEEVSYNYKQHITFSPELKKKSFFAKYGRGFIVSAAGLAIIAAAVIFVANSNKVPSSNDGDPASDMTTIQEDSTDAAEDIKTEAEETEPEVPLPRVEFSDSDKDKVLYSTLDDGLKPLYELIYNCVANSDESLNISSRNYDEDTVSAVYKRVLFDNPQFYYAESCTFDKVEGNSIGSIKPDYADLNRQDRKAVEAEAANVARDCEMDSEINTLAAIHDYMLANVKTVERSSVPYCSSAYGAMIGRFADDLGFAKAYCYYVQQAGFPCYVVEGEYKGQPRAWVRFRMSDEIWYNADVYGDVFAGDSVTKLRITEDGTYFKTFFLLNDIHLIDDLGYTLSKEFGFLLESEYAAAGIKENYYFQRNYHYYFVSSSENMYKFYLSYVVEKIQKNEDTSFACYMAPFLMDGMYDLMNSRFVDDLKEYGIEIQSFSLQYTPNTIGINLRGVTVNEQ